ncbi:MAG TPA: hypothetical protein VI316_09365 [Candidatus Dormibacteraeota bacterium]
MGRPASSLNAGEMLRRFTLGDRVILGSCVVFLIFSFFPWIGVDVASGAFGVSFDQSGLHGWGVLAFIVMLVVAAFVMIRSPLLNNQIAVPALPLADWMLLLIGGVITLGATLLYWVEYHQSVDTGLGSVGTTNRFGWYISLLAAIGICVGAYLKQNDPAPVAAGAGGGSVGGGYGATPPPQPGYGPPQYGAPQPPPAPGGYTPPAEQAPAVPEQPPQPPPGYGAPPTTP